MATSNLTRLWSPGVPRCLPPLPQIAAIRKTAGLLERIREHESQEQWMDALTCYEHALDLDPQNPQFHAGLIRCLCRLGNLRTAISRVRSFVEEAVGNDSGAGSPVGNGGGGLRGSGLMASLSSSSLVSTSADTHPASASMQYLFQQPMPSFASWTASSALVDRIDAGQTSGQSRLKESLGEVAGLGVAAAWRLGQWQEVESLLQINHSNIFSDEICSNNQVSISTSTTSSFSAASSALVIVPGSTSGHGEGGLLQRQNLDRQLGSAVFDLHLGQILLGRCQSCLKLRLDPSVIGGWDCPVWSCVSLSDVQPNALTTPFRSTRCLPQLSCVRTTPVTPGPRRRSAIQSWRPLRSLVGNPTSGLTLTWYSCRCSPRSTKSAGYAQGGVRPSARQLRMLSTFPLVAAEMMEVLWRRCRTKERL